MCETEHSHVLYAIVRGYDVAVSYAGVLITQDFAQV
jgi:hypothetical protein